MSTVQIKDKDQGTPPVSGTSTKNFTGTTSTVIEESIEYGTHGSIHGGVSQHGNTTTDDDVDVEEATYDDSESRGSSEFPYPVGDVTCWGSVKSLGDFCRQNVRWTIHNRTQIVSGITVALAQVPEAVSFSFVMGVNPVLGLQSAWIMGLCTSLAGGRPGMVAGATGAVSVVLTNLVREFGIGHLFYCIMLAGVFQIIFGIFRLGEAIRMIPHPVMVGFCNGLGLVIGFAQFNNFKVPDSQLGDEDIVSESKTDDEGSLAGVFRPFGAFEPLTNDRPWADMTMIYWMMFHAVITIITYALLPRISTTIPASVAAVTFSTILEYALVRPLGFNTYTVYDFDAIEQSYAVLPIWVDGENGYGSILPEVNVKLLGEIVLTAIFCAFIGLFESLLTMQIIDELTESKGSPNREACGQGLGQVLCGCFGGMGGCTTIGQSLMNMHSGGYTRLSSSVAAITLLLITLVAFPIINFIPVASLAGVMFLVSFFTIEWDSVWVVLGSVLPQFVRIQFGFHTKVKRSDVAIMVLVVAITLILDLAIAVITGVIIACLVFAWDAGTRLTVHRQKSSNHESGIEYMVRGPVYFGSIKPMTEAFFPLDVEPLNKDPPSVTVNLAGAEIYDWSGIMAIKTIHDRFESNETSATFVNLSIPSQSLMAKSKRLWDDVCILVEDDSDTESSTNYQEEGTGCVDDDNGNNTVDDSKNSPPMSSVVGGRPAWEGVSVLADDVDAMESGTIQSRSVMAQPQTTIRARTSSIRKPRLSGRQSRY